MRPQRRAKSPHPLRVDVCTLGDAVAVASRFIVQCRTALKRTFHRASDAPTHALIMQHVRRRRLVCVARAEVDERVRRTRRARPRRCSCARSTAGSGSSSAWTPTATAAPSPASPTARRRRGASRRTPDERSSRAADETSEAIERAGVAMVA